VIKSPSASALTGAGTLVLAWLMLRRIGRNEFAVQFALAVSFAGQVLFAVGIFGWFGLEHVDTLAWVIMTLTQGLLAVVMPNSIHRFWSALAATVAFYLLLFSIELAMLAPAIILALAAWTWLHEFSWPRRGSMIRPVAYGLVLGLVMMDMTSGAFQPLAGMNVELTDHPLLPPWLGQLLVGIVLLWVVWHLLVRGQPATHRKLAIAALVGVITLVLVSFKAPGLAVGAAIICLGQAHGNRVLTGIGIAALLAYASAYYYSLEATLLVKSQVLALTGASLLLVRWLMKRYLFNEPGADHA